MQTPSTRLSYTDFLSRVEAGKVATAEIDETGGHGESRGRGHVHDADPDGARRQRARCGARGQRRGGHRKGWWRGHPARRDRQPPAVRAAGRLLRLARQAEPAPARRGSGRDARVEGEGLRRGEADHSVRGRRRLRGRQAGDQRGRQGIEVQGPLKVETRVQTPSGHREKRRSGARSNAKPPATRPGG